MNSIVVSSLALFKKTSSAGTKPNRTPLTSKALPANLRPHQPSSSQASISSLQPIHPTAPLEWPSPAPDIISGVNSAEDLHAASTPDPEEVTGDQDSAYVGYTQCLD
jgi:hypothetical protein